MVQSKKEKKKPTEMCRSIKRFSKRRPEIFETTGSSGTSPETAKKMQKSTYKKTHKEAGARDHKHTQTDKQKKKN